MDEHIGLYKTREVVLEASSATARLVTHAGHLGAANCTV